MDNNLDESLFGSVDRYLSGLIPARDNVLEQMENLAREQNFPIIGPLVGELLFLLARSIGAHRVLELGSGYGYSAMHFAKAISVNGKVICTDYKSENALLAQKYFHDAELSHKLEFHVGNAVEIMESLVGEFDVVLMDVEKEVYPATFRKAWPRVRTGGLFIADNLLWHGRVFSGDEQPSTRAMHEFTRLIYETPGARSSIIPLRDGVSVTLKTI
ncbi:O-methyltransferase [candidate division KSB1 bacterium]|nr:MAG: O-methyltransferase [candidate division KSB1 bacterium]